MAFAITVEIDGQEKEIHLDVTLPEAHGTARSMSKKDDSKYRIRHITWARPEITHYRLIACYSKGRRIG
jgi:hypothetical protein